MIIEVKAKDVLNENKEGKVVKIFKNKGDSINSSEAIAEIEADKITMSVKPGINGIIQSIDVSVGDMIKADRVIGVINGEMVETQSQPKESTQQKAVGGFNYFENLIKPVKEEIECDIAIIGGGPGGYVAAIHAAKLGAKVVLVEKERLGGTCLNRGCIPTKSIVYSSHVYSMLKNANEFGCNADNITVNFKKVIERKNRVVKQLVEGIGFLMIKNGVKLIEGIGSIVDSGKVHVKENMKETIINARNIIIASGSKTASLPIKGMYLENVISSDEALEMEKLPRKMVIVGGGVIGMEFAYIYSNFGVDVSVVEYFDKCLINVDDDVAQENRKNAEYRGIKIFTGSKVEEIIKTEEENAIVCFVQSGEKKYITGEKILVAAGRIPYIEGMGIEKLGIELNEKGRGIRVNSKMQTNIPNIYAIGDVTNRMLLAHVASHQGMVAVNNIMGIASEMDYSAVPTTIFTDPEIAVVGVTEREARVNGRDIKVGKFPFSANGKALASGENSGFIKLIEDRESGRIIGGSIIGLHATELIAEVTLAVKNGLTPENVIETIHAHPTTAEVIHEGALSLEGGAIHFA